jgi:hypothetical protein
MSNCGGHLGWRADQSDTIFKEDHLRTFFLPSLVPIGSAVSEEKIIEKVYD